jgi:hypothetical protein
MYGYINYHKTNYSFYRLRELKIIQNEATCLSDLALLSKFNNGNLFESVIGAIYQFVL